MGAYAAYKRQLAEANKPKLDAIDLSDDDLPISARKSRLAAKIDEKESPAKRKLRSADPRPPKRRRVLKRLSYREESSSEPEIEPPQEQSPAPSPKSRRAARELAALRSTAGFQRLKSPTPSSRLPSLTSDAHTSSEVSDSDDAPLLQRKRRGAEGAEAEKEKPRKEVVQGMCEVVDFKIDNLRPTEKQFREADFLDSEPEGDEDWDGTNEGGGNDGYAW
jgi:hypothetical protein